MSDLESTQRCVFLNQSEAHFPRTAHTPIFFHLFSLCTKLSTTPRCLQFTTRYTDVYRKGT